jgi:hypothetical protein
MTYVVQFKPTARLPNAIAGCLGLIGVLTIAPARSENPPPGTWVVKAPMPAIRNEVAATVLDGKLYVLGGSVGGGQYDLTRNEEYDPTTDRWRVRAPLPHGANHMNAVTVNGKVYAFGGFAGSQHKGAVDGKIHVIGGRFGEPTDTTAMHEVYDPAVNSWHAAAPLPAPRSSLATALYKGMILVVGGETSTGSLTDNDGYDLKTDRWVKLAPLPSPRHGIAAGAVGNFAYFVGGAQGNGGNGTSDQLFAFGMP